MMRQFEPAPPGIRCRANIIRLTQIIFLLFMTAGYFETVYRNAISYTDDFKSMLVLRELVDHPAHLALLNSEIQSEDTTKFLFKKAIEPELTKWFESKPATNKLRIENRANLVATLNELGVKLGPLSGKQSVNEDFSSWETQKTPFFFFDLKLEPFSPRTGGSRKLAGVSLSQFLEMRLYNNDIDDPEIGYLIDEYRYFSKKRNVLVPELITPGKLELFKKNFQASLTEKRTALVSHGASLRDLKTLPVFLKRCDFTNEGGIEFLFECETRYSPKVQEVGKTFTVAIDVEKGSVDALSIVDLRSRRKNDTPNELAEPKLAELDAKYENIAASRAIEIAQGKTEKTFDAMAVLGFNIPFGSVRKFLLLAMIACLIAGWLHSRREGWFEVSSESSVFYMHRLLTVYVFRLATWGVLPIWIWWVCVSTISDKNYWDYIQLTITIITCFILVIATENNVDTERQKHA